MEECIFDYVMLNFECQFNTKTHSSGVYFLAAGKPYPQSAPGCHLNVSYRVVTFRESQGEKKMPFLHWTGNVSESQGISKKVA